MFFKKNQGTKTEVPSKKRTRERALIGLEVVVEGNVFTNGEIEFLGTINGDVRARVCVVESEGTIHGELFAEEAVVKGRVIGPIRALHVHIFPGAHVEGDIVSQTLCVEHGAHLDGTIRRSDDPFSDPVYEYEALQSNLEADAQVLHVANYGTVLHERPIKEEDNEKDRTHVPLKEVASQ